MAGRRETESLKPIDSVIFGMAASHRAVAQANTEVAPKVRHPGGRASNCRAKAAGRSEIWLRRSVTPAGWKWQHGDKDASQNWRSPPRPVAKSTEQGKSY